MLSSARSREQFRTGQGGEFRMRARSALLPRHSPPARCCRSRRQGARRVSPAAPRLWNAALLRCELRNRLGAVPPLQVRVAPQRAEAAARRIDQNAIELSGETPGAAPSSPTTGVWMLVTPRAPRAARARQAPGRHIHGVDAAGAAHQHRRSERLAAGAGAVIGDHLAPPRGEQPGEKLASFVLNLDEPSVKSRWRLMAGLPARLQPGEYGVGVACKPSAESSACALAVAPD